MLEPTPEPTDLHTSYLGLQLRNPLVPSASPLTGSLDTLAELQEAGAAAVVLPSLFEEQVEYDALLLAPDFLDETNPEAHAGYFPALDDYNTGSDYYIDLLEDAKRELAIPVIASLNGSSDGGWTHYAAALQDAGADALELNVYHVAADLDATSADVEDRYLRLVEQVRAEIAIPLAVKIGPYFSSPGNMARRLAAAGADGLVLFNRFYQPDIDLATLAVAPDLVLSTPAEMRLVLRWMAILRGRIDVDLAATTGVHSGEDVVKLVLAGADVVMLASALLRSGPAHLATVLEDLGRWFTDREYESLTQARGSVSQASVPDPSAFERANYMRTLTSWGRPPVSSG
jgi:dihydroorotate dehydrogenase (fumarate)